MKTRMRLFGARIKELRKKNNMSQEQLSEKVGIESKYLSRIEVGKSYPSLEIVEKLSDALDVEMKDLFVFDHLDKEANQLRSITTLLEGISEEKRQMIFKIIKAIVH